MALLQPKLSLKVAQRQILTPGLMQMVSVLALNKLDLKEMINAEIVENPVLEEMEENVPLLDDVASREAARERPAEEVVAAEAAPEKRDPFEEIDFGSYFQDYLDPGFRAPGSFEISEKPSFENFLSQPSTLTDHLEWQLGSIPMTDTLRDAADYIIGNLDEDGYLSADDDELLRGFLREQGPTTSLSTKVVATPTSRIASRPASQPDPLRGAYQPNGTQAARNGNGFHAESATAVAEPGQFAEGAAELPEATPAESPEIARIRALLKTALDIVQQLDPVGIASRDLRECLLVQIESQRRSFEALTGSAHKPARQANGNGAQPESSQAATQNGSITNGAAPRDAVIDEAVAELVGAAPVDGDARQAIEEKRMVFEAATRIVDKHLALLQKRDFRELAKAAGKPVELVQKATDFIRTLDPRPGQRYNCSEARLIEPDVAFVKRGDEYVVVMNEEDLPTLRLNQGYRRMLTQEGTEKEVKDYVKERYRSALQLMRNIEQRKNTILRTCEAIVRRQGDFLEHGVDALKPMMIKEVAEEIGVHPSTVSRAVSSKYVHTSQGVFELRFFFSEGVNGPEGAGTPLMLLKRKVKKLIEEEDSRKPLTDDLIAQMLQAQGIDVTRRTVAKYREDLRIPSTHQRRVRD